MRRLTRVTYALAGLVISVAAAAQESGTARPNLLHREIVAGMPRGERQEVRVITATFKPADKTVFHTHRFPVTVYVLEGAFTLELEGRAPVTVKAGEAMVCGGAIKIIGDQQYGKYRHNIEKRHPIMIIPIRKKAPGGTLVADVI